MTEEHYSRQTLDFILKEVVEVHTLFGEALFESHNEETMDFVLNTADEIARKAMLAYYEDSDVFVPEVKDGKVKVHHGVHEYYKLFADSGLLSATFPTEWDGQQLPRVIMAGVQLILAGAHNSFVMYTDLLKGAANLILAFGTEEQKKQFLPPMLNGQWGATMCLTESDSGSSLAHLKTTAEKKADGTYSLSGDKVFISAGDHDVTENMVHMVLARVKGAPYGVKGISLFIVPKKLNTTEGLKDNHVESVATIHKMGQTSTPAMHLSLGASGTTTGYLVGEENQGLAYMFRMMNGARLEVGMAGIATANTAFHLAVQYAKERHQGKSAYADPAPIIQHADVRRMLLKQKAFVTGAQAFLLYCFKRIDEAKASGKEDPMLDLLTPVVKTLGAEGGFDSVNQAVQVFGGYGYTKDFPVEQLLRDSRIYSIYEGTTGIQSVTLLGREILKEGGDKLKLWMAAVEDDLDRADAELEPYAISIRNELNRLTDWLAGAADNYEGMLADATIFMEYFSLLNLAWHWIRIGGAAVNQHKAQAAEFYQSMLATLRYFFKYEFSKCESLRSILNDEDSITTYQPNDNIF